MRVVMFYHSVLSDWNHGNAHFLRGIASELVERGHDVALYEPFDSWSRRNLLRDRGRAAITAFHAAYPALRARLYDPHRLDLAEALDGAELVIVHEWNQPRLVAEVGAYRRRNPGLRLLFHDTHHRAVSARDEIDQFDLRDYDGVLAFGKVLRDRYVDQGWTQRAWVWHEAADTRRFRPIELGERCGDLIWIGNWSDGERGAELRSFLLEPVRALALHACIYGVRYPSAARAALATAGARYCGSIANYEAPEAFARHRVTVHVPRRPYVESLPGIPTIRVFEALACGIPLVSSPWHDVEGLFTAGKDYLIARDGREMTGLLRELLAEPERAQALAAHGLATIRARHTCGHRVDELLRIHRELGQA